jgi:hypothetical protein
MQDMASAGNESLVGVYSQDADQCGSGVGSTFSSGTQTFGGSSSPVGDLCQPTQTLIKFFIGHYILTRK